MSLLDRLVPASALRWGVLTGESPALPAIWDIAAGRSTLHSSGVEYLRSLGRPFDGTAPDPAAAWGEADRRAEDR